MPKFRHFIIIVAGLWLACFVPASFSGETLAIIVNPSRIQKDVSTEMLKRIYLRKSMLDDHGNAWYPINLPIEHELRQGFSQALFGKRPEDQEHYWNTQYFHGINPPYVLMSEEAMLRFIAITPNAIGYVRLSTVDARVKVIKRIALSKDK